ncbi:MAG: hypothetical protein DWQ05_18370 [Calditrichaeota bacterium]|nr:MAG: hypothetical protein DWQ05_18370 [Calditrichota bacterium]
MSVFPKEFERDYLRSTDWKFLMLATASILIHAFSIIYLFQNYPAKTNPVLVKQAQSRFAKKYLTGIENFKMKNNSSLGYFNSSADKIYPNKENNYHAISFVKNDFISKKMPIASPKNGSADGGISENQRLVRNVSHIGLLGVINSGKASSSADVQSFYAYLDSTSLNLDQKRESFDTFEVPRPGVKYSHSEGFESIPGFIFEMDETATDAAEQIAAVQDQLPAENIQYLKEVLYSHNPVIQECYRQYLFIDPDLAGKLSLRFVLNPAGEVTYATVIHSTLGSKPFEEKILSKIRKWKNFGIIPTSKNEIRLRHTYVFQ